jgi:hypothetical protein
MGVAYILNSLMHNRFLETQNVCRFIKEANRHRHATGTRAREGGPGRRALRNLAPRNHEATPDAPNSLELIFHLKI